MTILQHLPATERFEGVSTTCESPDSQRLGRKRAELARDLQSCDFPCLDSSSVSGGDWQSVEVPYRDALGLQSFCKEHGTSSLAVLRTAWALVLRCYIGGNPFYFGHVVPKATSELDGAGYAWASSVDFTTYHMDFEESDTVTAILRAEEADPSQAQKRIPTCSVYADIQAMEPCTPLSNTALQVQEVRSVRRLAAGKSFLQGGASHGVSHVNKTPYDHRLWMHGSSNSGLHG